MISSYSFDSRLSFFLWRKFSFNILIDLLLSINSCNATQSLAIGSDSITNLAPSILIEIMIYRTFYISCSIIFTTSPEEQIADISNPLFIAKIQKAHPTKIAIHIVIINLFWSIFEFHQIFWHWHSNRANFPLNDSEKTYQSRTPGGKSFPVFDIWIFAFFGFLLYSFFAISLSFRFSDFFKLPYPIFNT